LILGLIIVLVILSVLFGGFSKGTKADGASPSRPVPVSASMISAGMVSTGS